MPEAYRPQAYIDFEVYEDSVNLIGVAKVSLPAVTSTTISMMGAGIGGTVETPLAGMIEAMSASMEFRSATDALVRLMAPKKHHITLRAVEQEWDMDKVEQAYRGLKIVMVVLPKSTKPGTIAPAAAADASGEYSVFYYAAYKDGRCLWEIDPFNQVFTVDGVDYWADIRKLLGK